MKGVSEKNEVVGSLNLSSAGVSDVGKVRKRNEDSLLVFEQAKVFCVADGMGGAAGGDVASQKTVELIESALLSNPNPGSFPEQVRLVAGAVNDASEWIYDWARSNQLKGTGTTLVALLLTDEYPWAATVLHAGDSRLYLFRENKLRQVSRDHSIEEAIGENDGQAIPDKFKDLITNAIGLKKTVSLEVTHSNQLKGDIWLLCSDGLSKMLDDRFMEEMLSKMVSEDAEKIAQSLMDAANAAGGRDNITVVVVKVLECSEMPDGAVAVPFTESLACEEPFTNTAETAATVAVEPNETTDSSDLVSISSTDSATLGEVVGVKNSSSKLRLAVGLGCLFVVLVLFFVSRACSTRQKAELLLEQEPRREVVREAVSLPMEVKEPQVREPISKIKADAIRTGEWKRALSLAAGLSGQGVSVSDERDYDIIQGWSSLWENSCEPGFSVSEEYVKYHEVSMRALVLFGSENERSSSYAGWAGDTASQASEYCRRIYALQSSWLGHADEFIDAKNRELSFFRPDPHPRLEQIKALGGFSDATLASCAGAYSGVAKNLKGLRRWIGRSRDYPISAQQLKKLLDSYVSPIIQGENLFALKLSEALGAISLDGILAQHPKPVVQDAVRNLREIRNRLVSKEGKDGGSPPVLDRGLLDEFFQALETLDKLIGSQGN